MVSWCGMGALDEAVAAVARRQHGVFSHADAVALGASRRAIAHRLNDGTWEQVARRVYRLAGTPPTWRGNVLAAVFAAGPDSVASHRSAAALHGLPGFPEGPLHVVRWRETDHRSAVGPVHRSRRLLDRHMTVVDGIPVTTVARTIFDLAACLHPKRVERALDNSLAMGLATLADHRAVLDDLAKRGRAGTRLVRRLLDERSAAYVPPASELEARFLDIVRDFGLPMPEREVVLGDDGGPVGRVEFVYRQARLLIELDGRRHHMAKLDFEADRARDNRFAAAGWRVVRLTWDMVTRRPDEAVRALNTALAAA
jgi:predicted transcriptional regulator of viral defense system